MPSSADIAANKAKSQARQIILAMRLRGHKNVDIARAIGAEASAVQRIVKGDTPGDALLPALRGLAEKTAGLVIPPLMSTVTPAETPATGTGAPPSAEPLPVVDATPPQGGTLPADLEGFEAPEPEHDGPKGLAARLKNLMLGGGSDVAAVSAPKAKASGGKDALQGQFVAQVLPVVALGVVWASDLAIRDPYKPVAPTVNEAQSILAVPVRWLARELDVRGQLSERTMELLVMLVAVGAYGHRAYGTYQQIKAEEHARSSRERSDGLVRDFNATANPASASVSYAAGGHGGAGADAAHHAERGPGGGARSRRGGPPDGAAHDGARGGVRGADAGGDRQPGASTADIMAAISRADYEGRVRLGLLG